MSAPSFDLVTEAWIPVRDASGRMQRVGLQDALLKAPSWVAIAGPSPLATFALHRVLLALLHHALQGPQQPADWRRLKEAGRFPDALLHDYFTKWRHRLDLRHPERPFFQVPKLSEDGAGPVSKLFQERSSGNNAVWFDHSWDDQERSLPWADAAVQLLVVQAYSLGGLLSFPKGADPAVHKSAKSSLLVGHAAFLVGGTNLFDTLLHNLVGYQAGGNRPFEGQSHQDAPSWAQERLPEVGERHPLGYLDLMTWQARRVSLLPAPDGSGVAKVVVYKGESLPETFGLFGKDPALVFKTATDPKAPNPHPPLGFRPDKALWRDATVLLAARKPERGGPEVLVWLGKVMKEDAPGAWPLGAYGLANDKAKAEFWREEHLLWPTAYLESDGAIGDALTQALDAAERVAKLLGGGYVPIHDKNHPAPLRVLGEALRVREAKALGDWAKGLGGAQAYWAALEPAFRRLLMDLPDDIHGPAPGPARRAWGKALRQAAREAFRFATTGLRQSPRDLMAWAQADQVFHRQLAVLEPELKVEEEVSA